MIPELFSIGPLSISPFGVLLAGAFVACYFQLRSGLLRLDAGDEEDASALVLAAGIGGVLGAKLYYAVLVGDPSVLLERFGLVWYGGFILGTVAVLWTIHRRRMPAWRTADAAAPALALGYAVGRIGCFLVGDDYGRPTDLPWAVTFPHGLPATTAGSLRRHFGIDIPADVPDAQLLPVHPTQLYETLACLAIWALGVWLLRRGSRPGGVVLPVLGLLAVERFAVEFLRAKDDRFFGDFTMAQGISLVVLVVVAWIWAARRRER